MSMEIGLGRFGDRRLEKGGSCFTRLSFGGHARRFGVLPETARGRCSSRAFLRNERVSVEEMASHAAARTALRVAGRDIIVIQDTSELVIGGAARESQWIWPRR